MKAWVSVFNEPPKRTPPRHMPDGPLLGNGDLGVVMSGAANALTFLVAQVDHR